MTSRLKAYEKITLTDSIYSFVHSVNFSLHMAISYDWLSLWL